MKKYIIILVAIFSIVSCKTGDEEPKGQKEILEKINSYKMNIVELEGKISDLNSKLAGLDVSSTQGSILVGLESIKAKEFTHYLDVTGSVEPQLQAYISPELNGLIKTIKVKEGDYVKKGDLLAIIDTEMTLNTIEEVKTQLELAKAIYNKQKELWDQKIGSEIQYLQAKSKKESLEKKLITLRTQIQKASIKAPFSGHIETVAQKVGEFGSPNKPLFFLVNLDDLKIIANISESFLPYIHVNDLVSVKFPTYPKIKISARIGVIGSVINPNNRTIKIQVPIKNIDKDLLPNITAQIKVVDQYFEAAFVVPSIVVKNDANGNKYVYVVSTTDAGLFAKKKFITTGNSYGNQTMVLAGLNEGDKVITKAYNLVKNGSAIRLK